MSLRIALTSDLHLGITSEKVIRKFLEEVAAEAPDVYVNAGDYSGGFDGWRKVRQVVAWEKAAMPSIPRLAVLGNHDRWVRGRKRKGTFGTSRPFPSLYMTAMERIEDDFAGAGTHFLDKDGVHKQGGYTFLGHSGWYEHMQNTNDWNYLPHGIAGDTQAYLLKEFEDVLHSQLAHLTEEEKISKNLICITHMPIFYDRQLMQFQTGHGGRGSLGEFLQKEYGVRYFLNGHMHERHEGPIRFESGSDYYRPRYLIINLP